MAFGTSNILFQLAADMVNHSSQNIFPTGKAETGKTTFLMYMIFALRKISPIYIVAGSVTLHEMSLYLPQSVDELAQISGFGKREAGELWQPNFKCYTSVCEAHKLSSLIHEKPPKRKRK